MTTRKLERVIINICRVQVSSESSIYMKVCFLCNKTLQQSALAKTPWYLPSLADIQPTGKWGWCLIHRSTGRIAKDLLFSSDQAPKAFITEAGTKFKEPPQISHVRLTTSL